MQCGTERNHRGCQQTSNRRKFPFSFSHTHNTHFGHSVARTHAWIGKWWGSTASGLRASLLNIILYVNIKWDLKAQITQSVSRSRSLCLWLQRYMAIHVWYVVTSHALFHGHAWIADAIVDTIWHIWCAHGAHERHLLISICGQWTHSQRWLISAVVFA